MASIQDIVAGLFPAGIVQYNTAALAGSTASVGHLTGSAVCIFANSGATPAAYTTRTATQMVADGGLVVNQTWLILIANVVTTNVLTLTAGTGVTVTGTATVAGFTARLFVGTVNTATTITIDGKLVSWTVAV